VLAWWALKSEGWCRCSSDRRFCPRLSAAGPSFAESVDGRRARGRLFPAAWAIPARDDLTWFTLASNLQCLQRALQRPDAGLIALYCRRRMGAAAAAQISTQWPLVCLPPPPSATPRSSTAEMRAALEFGARNFRGLALHHLRDSTFPGQAKAC
jgi:hypothetical protein